MDTKKKIHIKEHAENERELQTAMICMLTLTLQLLRFCFNKDQWESIKKFYEFNNYGV